MTSEAADGQAAPAGRLRVVVLTCDGLGLETARALEAVPEADVVAVVDAPHRRPPLKRRLRHVWRTRGAAGLAAIAAGKATAALRRLLPAPPSAESADARPACPVLRFRDLHDADCLAALRDLTPDLAVVDGTGILRPELFDLPRLGSLNLHCGRVPDYRGSPPAFWELWDGVDRVGVTIHRVTERLDEGPVLLEEEFPLDPAPAQEPRAYARRVWRETLRPAGVRMLGEAVARLASGTAEWRPQPRSDAPTRRTPTLAQVRELRRRVRARRRAGGDRTVISLEAVVEDS